MYNKNLCEGRIKMKTIEQKMSEELYEVYEEYSKSLKARNKILKELIETKKELEEAYGQIDGMLERLAELGDSDAIEIMEILKNTN